MILPLLRPAQALRARIERWHRHRRYWLRAAIALVLGLLLGILLGRQHLLLPVRYRIYSALTSLLPDRDPLWTAVVLIGDDEYWKGRLAGYRYMQCGPANPLHRSRSRYPVRCCGRSGIQRTPGCWSHSVAIRARRSRS